jgi:hypothetical protein
VKALLVVTYLAAVAGAAAAALSVDGARRAAGPPGRTGPAHPFTTWVGLAAAMATSGTYTLDPDFSVDGYSGTITLTKGVDATVLGQRG